MSFPAFRYQELIREDWDESELLSRLDRFIFVPIVGHKGLAAVGSCLIQQPISWTPADEELAVMAEEWTMFRDEVEAGVSARANAGLADSLSARSPEGEDVVGHRSSAGSWASREEVLLAQPGYVARILRKGHRLSDAI